jgi:hypothetical protein
VSNFLRGENDTSFVIEGVGISDDVVLFLRWDKQIEIGSLVSILELWVKELLPLYLKINKVVLDKLWINHWKLKLWKTFKSLSLKI